jgi:ribose-phosphate pyrophosphokinase
MMLLSFPDSAAQGAELAAAAGMVHAVIDVHRFPDGESRLQLPPQLPAEVVLLRSLHDPNAKLTELLIAAGGARALGAARLTLVAPYLCYMRQDKAFAPGQPVSQRIVGALLASRFDAVITVDPHLHRVATLAEAVPAAQAVALSAADALGEWLAARVGAGEFARPLLIGPDEESAQWVTRVAAPGGFDSAVARKERFSDTEVRVTLPAVDMAGRTAVLVDDVIASGHTLMEAAQGLRRRGATDVVALATHGLFAPGAREGMAAAGINRVVTTDAIPNPTAVIRLAPLLAQALRSSAKNDR